VIRDLLPFVRGLTLMFWATATWWIPMLVILGVWRHVYRRFPLVHDPLNWAPGSRSACIPCARSDWPRHSTFLC